MMSHQASPWLGTSQVSDIDLWCHPRRGRNLGKKFFCPTQIWITIVCVYLELKRSRSIHPALSQRITWKALHVIAVCQGEITTTFHIFSWTCCTWDKLHNSSANKTLPPFAHLLHQVPSNGVSAQLVHDLVFSHVFWSWLYIFSGYHSCDWLDSVWHYTRTPHSRCHLEFLAEENMQQIPEISTTNISPTSQRWEWHPQCSRCQSSYFHHGS